VLTFAFAAGSALSLDWGRLHIHRIHNDGVVGARRRGDGFLRLHGATLRFAPLGLGALLHWCRRVVWHHEVVLKRERVGHS
jgi:hypothetical protein